MVTTNVNTQRQLTVAPAAGIKMEWIELGEHGKLIRSGATNILVNTCTGDHGANTPAATALLHELRLHGVAPREVHTVLLEPCSLTCNNALLRVNSFDNVTPTLPNARYIVMGADSQLPRGLMTTLEKYGCTVAASDTDEEIAPGVRITANGHAAVACDTLPAMPALAGGAGRGRIPQITGFDLITP